jgi:hypothetical protein
MAEEKMGKLLQMFKDGSTPKEHGGVNIKGNNNQVAGRDIINNINRKETIVRPFQPGPEHISAVQAKKLYDLVLKAAERDAGGDPDKIGSKRAGWWSRLRNHYGVPNYREIPAHLGDEAIKWLQQQIAMNRPKIRRANNQEWRKDHYIGIWAKMSELGMSKGDIYALVKERLGKQVVSLTKLGERDLKAFYQIMMRMK